MGWLASQPVVASIISGATNPDQVEENARSADWRLTADELKEVDAILGVVTAGGQMMGPPPQPVAATPARA
jgi:aryl-alcohol dehydrogenase-like predicted oxidoreductase